MIRTSAAILGAMFVLAAGCGQPPQQRPALVLSGSRSMVPLLRDIAARFGERRPDIRIDIEPTGGERALMDTRQGLADIGLLARALRADEGGVRGQVLARDGLAVVVHRSNPVAGLSAARVAVLFNRGYASWKDLGGSDRPIKLVGLSEGRTAREVFLDHLNLSRGRANVDLAVSSSEQAVEAVGQAPNAVGYASIGPALLQASQPVRLLPLDGVAATLENVHKGDYPLVRPLLLLTREPASPAVQAFLDFARSAGVHDLIRKHGFVPADPTRP